MNLKEQLIALQKAMQTIVDGAKSANRDLTESEIKDLEEKAAEAIELKGKIERAEKGAAILESIGGMQSEGAGGSFLALTGRGSKGAAQGVVSRITQTHGAKAFLTPGTEVFATPLTSTSPLELQQIPTSILEVLKSVQRETPKWDYLRQTAFNNQAAIVAPGDTKPTSTVTIGKAEGSLSVFAHLTEPVDKYLLEDNDALASFISNQMLYGLARKLETEVLSGAGTAGHLMGMLNATGVQIQAAGPDKVTTLRLAATQLEVLGYSTDVYIVNPLDWAAIETARATSGSFDLGGPIDRAQRKVWGTQVITSTGVPAGTALALDLDAVSVDRDTRGVQVEWDRSQGFATNEVIARVEGRFGLSIYRPDAIIKITLPTAP